ncbi:MAG TPA: secondary thiamine-phosphate synthase enzyme YjbQ [Spirochaetia bacterium]|nr:secondary thiamine-phosphate synthase enzyme YjbQ [Spirochaetia bacterium]
MERLRLSTTSRTEFINITAQVKQYVLSSGVQEGICHIYVPHTSAGLMLNEAADPDVPRDILKELNKMVPFEDDYAHRDGNAAAHIKATMLGSSVTVPIAEGRLALGTWQGVFLGEFDGPRSRSVYLQIVRAT